MIGWDLHGALAAARAAALGRGMSAPRAARALVTPPRGEPACC
jgi:hypothetical protein